MTCEQVGCPLDAVVAFTWPGRAELGACLHHALVAAGIADAMGFKLDVHRIDQLIATRAADAVARLRNVRV